MFFLWRALLVLHCKQLLLGRRCVSATIFAHIIKLVLFVCLFTPDKISAVQAKFSSPWQNPCPPPGEILTNGSKRKHIYKTLLYLLQFCVLSLFNVCAQKYETDARRTTDAKQIKSVHRNIQRSKKNRNQIKMNRKNLNLNDSTAPIYPPQSSDMDMFGGSHIIEYSNVHATFIW